MAFINFDCPECGHNLEVDERGAGFIIKCPECDHPLQIPELPKSHRIRKSIVGGLTIALFVALAAGCVFFASRDGASRRRAADSEEALAELTEKTGALAAAQEAELTMLRRSMAARSRMDPTALSDAAREVLAEAERLARQLDDAERRLLEASPRERDILLRKNLRERMEEAKASLPNPPIFNEAEPGKGLMNTGRQLIFPVLLSAEGKPLRENVEITGLDGDHVSVRFQDGSASYRLAELHPGVVAYLPAVDPLLILPSKQRQAEALRIHQTECARRSEALSALRHDLETQISAVQK